MAAVGAATLLAMVGYLGWSGLTQPEGPPELAVAVQSVQPSGDGYLVEYVARNTGPTTAAAVWIAGRLSDGDAVVEESVSELEFLPQRSARRGGLLFTTDPAAHELTLRVLGFAYP